MHTKLTLRLDADPVRKAKADGESLEESVSRMVADYFRVLDEPIEPGEAATIPLTQSLRGVLRDTGVDEADYHDHLADRDR